MAVKIFCNMCQTYIKDAINKNEIRNLTGSEVCESCSSKAKTAMDEIIKASKRSIVQIESLRDQRKAELERMYKKVIKADE